jgi:hypothetical protein
MKHAITLVCLVIVLATNPLFAQVTDETIITFDVIQTERKALVLEALDLTPAQVAEVAEVYDRYLAELDQLEAQEVALIQRFLKSYKALSDLEAAEMLRAWGAHNQARLDLRKYYTREFSEVLPPRKVLRLWQIENKLDTIVDAQLTKDIPLAN